MNKKTSMRDPFFDTLYELAKQDRNVVVVSADMGAPSLDRWRTDIPGQYVNVGIAEQSAITVASGLALSGKKPYVFAIMPFITSRIHEFLKLELALMKLPITVVGVGAGYSYEDSGPTHHSVEDISIVRALPNITILSASDSVMASAFAKMTYHSNQPAYVRLDRMNQPEIHNPSERFEDGFNELKQGEDICIVATGNMVANALEVQRQSLEQGRQVGVIDLYRLKPVNPSLGDVLSRYKRIISLEEHLLDGGLGSILSEIITDAGLPLRLRRIGVTDYNYEYGGRDYIQKKMGIDVDVVMEVIKYW